MKLYSHFSANNIKLEEMPFTAELAMEAYIIENPDILKVNEGDEVEIVDYELSIKNGRRTSNGRIDLLVSYNETKLGILELKKGCLQKNHFDQLNDYFGQKKQLETILNDNYPQQLKPTEWIGILVGSDIDNAFLKEIEEGLQLQGKISLIAIVIKRFKGNNGQIYITTETFASTKTKKDYSRYNFENVLYQKNRLVRAVIAKYVADNPNITLSELQNKFPKDLTGKGRMIECVLDADEAKIKAKTPTKSGKTYDYYFIKDNELITLGNGQKIAVTSWWDKYNLDDFIAQARKIKYAISKVES
ncbi:hypothetical protein LJB91_02905 [Bacteroidales bacterium OttesenSCG-928-L03]|nr:hypothetical protein [Bacteroidales bacterium OttesenSCG-928-L03]